MNQRSLAPIVCILLILIILSGCEKKEVAIEETAEETPIPLVWIEDIPVDNETPLEQLLSVDYPLSELRNWFPEFSVQEISRFHRYEYFNLPLFSEVNERFPIQCLRWNYKRFYTIYKVREGGYFYVFWMTSSFPKSDLSEPVRIEGEIIVSSCYYLNERPSESVFSSLVPGVSTGADVKAIDPELEWSLLNSSWDRSYSLLDDGRILTVYYVEEEPRRQSSTDEFVIDYIEIYQEMTSGSALAAIMPKDLP